MQLNGVELQAVPCTADDWFAALELEKKRDQDYYLISKTIRREDGSLYFMNPEDIGTLPVTTYAKLYSLTVEANAQDEEDAEKK